MRAGIAALFIGLLANLASASTLEDRRAQCVGWMMQGYPSGIEETSCTAQFALPSAFLFKCMRAQRAGYDSETQRNACRIFLEEASLATQNGYVRQN